MDRIPTYSDFKRGLRANTLTDLDLDVLDCFLQAENFALTSSELAAALGSQDHRYGNLRIGTLGSSLADAMDFTPNLRASDQTPMYWNVVAKGHHRPSDEHFVFTLHPELVEALQQFPTDVRSGRPLLGHIPRDERPPLTPEQQERIAARIAERRGDRGLD